MSTQYSKCQIEKANAIPIVEVLKRLGIQTNGNKPLLCPFHNEKTPSLNINRSKNAWKCFGCGEGGDVVALVMKHQKISFPDALAWLLGESSKIKVQAHKNIKSDSSNSNLPVVINPILYKYFLSLCSYSTLIDTFYIGEKKIKKEVIRNAEIKAIEDPVKILKELLKGWDIQQLIKSGIVTRRVNKKTGEMFNSLTWYKKGTVIIPFFNELNKITYLKGRVLNQKSGHNNMPNSKTDIYNRVILKSLKKDDVLYVCEGESDTLSALSLGYNAIGLLGASSFNSEYVNLLKHYKLHIVYDNDNAGKNFYRSIRDAFDEIGISVNRVAIPSEYNDLNEYYVNELS